MTYEIKNAIIQRDNLDESFNLVDPKGYFKDEKVLVAIDGDTLITIQLLINSIIKNDFKKWKKIKNSNDFSDSLSKIFLKLGYSRKDLTKLIKDLES
ncbi:MAG: hypothetical protein LBU74_02095 [Methanobacteriaceae archaeon]|jgi:hypothetical protein|nr:hypothetical protein [Candidatus Methanorudis spinitermitis]